MSESKKTLIFAAVALGLAVTAFVSRPKVNRDVSDFIEERTPFYPEVQPDNVKGLEVTAYDKDRGEVDTFSVKLENNAWTIPSHNDYPADAEERLKKTAGAVLALQKDAVVPGGKELHKEYGVIDPTDNAGDANSWGTRVKLTDVNGNVVSDLIVGKQVPDKTDFRFVRIPDKDRVYQVKCTDLDLTTRFADWINTDLITDSSFDFNRIEIKDYRLERLGSGRVRLNDQGVVELDKNAENKWVLAGLKEGETTDETKANDLATAISDLKILGVRPKPPGLTADLNILEQQFVAESMISRGFFPTEDGRVVSNDGEVITETSDGLRYTLRFGGVFIGRGEEVEAGKEDEKVIDPEAEPKADAPADGEKSEGKEDRKEQENRFLLVSVSFNEDRFPPIEPPAEPSAEKPAPPAEAPAAPAEGAPAVEPAAPPADSAPAEEKPAPAPAADSPAEAAPPANPENLQNIAYQEPAPPAEPTPAAEPEPAKVEPAPEAPVEAPAVQAPATEAPAAEPAAEAAPAAETVSPADEAAQKEAELEAKIAAEEAKREYERKKAERDRKIEEGKKKAQELEERYGRWFYVISNEQAKKVRLNREAFIKLPEAKEGEAGAPGADAITPPPPPEGVQIVPPASAP